MAYNDSRGSHDEGGRGGGGRDGGRDGGSGGPRRRRTQVRTARVCAFCVDKDKEIDYKQTDTLKRYHYRPRPDPPAAQDRPVCQTPAANLLESVKRARFMALLPYTGEHVRLYG